jgi:DNA helicase IV
VAHPDLPSEQAYVDHAYACLDRMRETLEQAGNAGVGEVAAAALEAFSARRLQTFADAERGLCFGRLDVDDTARPLYIGRRWVHDDDQDVVVVNWQAPAARPFYTATPSSICATSSRRSRRISTA